MGWIPFGHDNIFYTLLDSVLLRMFVSVFMKDIDLWFSYDIFIWFWYQGNTDLIEWVGKYFLLVNFFGRFCEGLMLILLKHLVEFPNKTIWIWVHLCRKTWLLTQSLYLLMVYLDSMLLVESVWAVCIFLGICPFQRDYLICWHIVVHSILL